MSGLAAAFRNDSHLISFSWHNGMVRMAREPPPGVQGLLLLLTVSLAFCWNGQDCQLNWLDRRDALDAKL